MKLRQRVIRHHRVHMVLKVVVHVHVQKAQHAVHVDSAAVAAMIEHVFSQTHMLSKAEQVRQPAAIKHG